MKAGRGHPVLTNEQVTTIRTSKMTDTHFARLYRTTSQSINQARRGLTFKHVSTPPDVAPRLGCGRMSKLNPVARPAKVRRVGL